MQQVRDLGFTLSLDDFGTGYSSLSYLKHLPFYELKTDRSFVELATSHCNDAFLIQLIISMGQKFGMSVVAEDIKTQEQLALLKNFNCKVLQGYLFAKPLDLRTLETVLSNQDSASLLARSIGRRTPLNRLPYHHLAIATPVLTRMNPT